jgi:hypothetical protein
MMRNARIVMFLIAASAVCAVAAPARAQVTTGGTINAKPTRAPEAKPIQARFEVLHMTNTAIQVRSLVNQREIHTLIYSSQIRAQMQKVLSKGGYQYGDKVKIRYQPGAEVALNIKGKPSKPH